MDRFAPFRGSTYSTAVVEPAAVVAPPYDVVGPAERAELARRSPYNSILVELPEDPGGGDAYDHAAALWRGWHDEGVIEVAPSPSLYLYRMTFAAEDETVHTTTGVMGALGLDPEQRGAVLPHEQTIAKDMSDRLSLLRATRTNLSPIWGLSLARGLGALCAELVDDRAPDVSADDSEGTLHQMWVVSDEGSLSRLTALVSAAPVLIADGHHRYQTACAYLEESAGSIGADAVLAYVVELAPDELTVEAIHRLLSGVGTTELVDRLEESFQLSPGPATALELRDAMTAGSALGLLTGRDSAAGGNKILVPRAELLEVAAEDLDSSRLEVALARMPGVTVTYQHGVLECARAVEDGRATAAVLLRPATVGQIAATAHGGRKMPPKTTFFSPKLRTGMVFRELDQR